MKIRTSKRQESAKYKYKSSPQSDNEAEAGRRQKRATLTTAYGEEFVVDLMRRRDQLVARVAELQWDLGGLAYEMAVRAA